QFTEALEVFRQYILPSILKFTLHNKPNRYAQLKEITYILKRCTTFGNIVIAREIFDMMSAEDLPINIFHINTIMIKYAMMGDIKEVLNLFELAKKKKMQLDDALYNNLIVAYVKINNVNKAK